MSRIISRSTRKTRVEYSLSFHWAHDPGAGFSFTCDRDGNIDAATMNPAALENLALCLSGQDAHGHRIIADGVRESSWSYTEPAVLHCDCGRQLTLDDPMDNICACGRVYNLFGQRLEFASWDSRCEEPYWEEEEVGGY